MTPSIIRFVTLFLPLLFVSADDQATHSLLRGRRVAEQVKSGVVSNVLGIVTDWLDVQIPSEDPVQTTIEEQPPFFKDPTKAAMYGQPISLTPVELKDEGKIANVVGGSDASSDEAPWQVIFMFWNVAMSRWDYNGCGGTVISDRHILTAGHCAERGGEWMHLAYIRAYQPFLGNPGVEFDTIRVQEYTMHPFFEDGPNNKDVAIATLQEPIKASVYSPITLAETYPMVDGDLIDVYGFGRIAESDRTRVDTLQTVQVPYIPGDQCWRYHWYNKVKEDMFCAGYIEGGRDACNGDSGGPAVYRDDDGNVQQVGVVSWGDGCARFMKPGVYADVTYFYSWIKEIVCSDTETTSPLCEEATTPQGEVAPPAEESCTLKADGVDCFNDNECCSNRCSVSADASANSKVCRASSSSGTFNHDDYKLDMDDNRGKRTSGGRNDQNDRDDKPKKGKGL